MEFIPDLSLGFLNGWLPLAVFYLPFGALMLIWPKDIVAKLYDISGWSKFERNMSLLAKPFSFSSMALLIFAPLKRSSPVFWIGLALYLVGYVVIFTALFNYRNTPVDKPVARGLYRYSRNPQWLGLLLIFFASGVMTGFGLVLLLLTLSAATTHFRILGEERVCLQRYGDSYQRHLEEVPRYFAVF
ncbi:MAG: methyltransferase [Anaerolineales bacterium]|jgi:protein-S-isoprenylcysteine O-methyltransferase Ste14